MKKIFTLLASVLVGVTMFAQDAVTATWALGTKASGTPAGFDGVVTEGFGLTAKQTAGSNATPSGNTRTEKPSTGEFKTSSWKQAVNGGYNADTYVDFTLTPGGREFTLDKVEFDAAGAKTGNLRADIHAICGDIDVELKKNVAVVRGDEDASKDADKNFHLSYNVAGIENTLSPVTLRIYFYSSNASDGSSRELCLANVVISGTLKADDGDTREVVNLAWDPASVDLKIRDAFTAPVLINEQNVPVTYAASGNSATVSEDGVISLVEGELGETIITATFEGNETYKPAKAECTINVKTNVVVVTLPAPYDKGEDIVVDGLYSASGATKAGQVLLTDDNIVVTGVSASNAGKISKEYLGHKFSNSIQVRTAAAPNAENPNGTVQDKSTAVTVTPAKNLTLVVFGRRQAMDVPELTTVEDDVENNVITETHYNGWVANDGKSLKVYCVEDGADVSQEIVLGDFQDASYAFVATKVELEAGKNYTLYALGTTYVVNGIGYILPLMDADIAYPVEKYDYKFGSTDNELPVLANPNNLPVTYASSNTEVATVDENGNVDVLAVGTTVISATFEAANGYRGAVAQYTLSVAEAATVVSFIPGDKNNQGYEVCGTSSDNKSLTIGGVSYKSNLLYLANSWGDNENYIKLGVEGGFKKGDVVTIKGAINSGSKTAGIHLYSTKEHKLMTSEDFVDVKGDTSLEPTTVSYTLEAAAKNLYIARNGSTGLYICYISVEHPYSYVEPEAPEAPSYTAATGDDNVTVYTFTVAEGHNIYYRFDAAEEATEPETPAAAPMREAAATLEHDGQTYQLLNGSLSFTKNDNGTLTYFAHNPETDGRSELVTETISGGTTGLEEISAEAGVVEYYNLQGIRVAAPAEGVYIRKQGDNVSKVYVK